MNGINDPHEYQTTVLNTEILNNENPLNHYIGLGNGFVYKNNYTAFATMGTIENNYETSMYLYNHKRNELTTPYNWGSYLLGDYHSSAAMVWLKDGRLLVGVDTDHNDQIQFKRSVNAYDITDYEIISTLGSVESSIEAANITLKVLGDRVYCILRGDGVQPLANNSIMYSDDNGETWSTINKILDLESFDDFWAYPVLIDHPSKLIFLCYRRNTVSGVFDRIYYLESTDGVNWSNKENDFSFDITSSFIDSVSLNLKYLILDTGATALRIANVFNVENQSFIITQNSDDETLDFRYFDGSSLLSRSIDITPVKLRFSNAIAAVYRTALDIDLYVNTYDTFQNSPNLNSRVVKITTNDAFVTYGFEYLTEVGNSYTIKGGGLDDGLNKGIVTVLELKDRGTGTDVEPLNAFSNFKILDVIN